MTFTTMQRMPAVPSVASVTEPVVLRLRLIGQMEAWTLTSENVLPAGRKTRALLAFVALSAPRPALRSRLAEMLWSRRPEEQARASLRQEIHRLLEVLDGAGLEVLTITRDHIALRPGRVWVDVEEVLRATTARPASLALLDGELLEDLDGIDPAFDVWLTTERERLRDKARSLAESLLREQVEPDTAIPAAQQLLSIDRAHEGAWRALMRAHAARGERGMAIQAYERCRAVLADLLDTTPSPETQRLLAEIRGPTGGKPVISRPAAPLPMPAAPPHVVPVVTPLVSESRESIPRAVRGGARVGVLPLKLSGTGEDEAHLSTGLADEITTALARFRWMFLVSSNSLARFAAETRDEAAIRRVFGLDFLLDGSIQRVRNRLRITLRLIDLRTAGQVVWARRFDRQANDLLTLQDEIAAEVVAQIDPELLLIEAQRVATRPPTDPTAYDLVLRAMPLITRMEKGQFLAAGTYLARAIELEPDYANAHAWYAFWHNFLVGQGWADDPEWAMAEAGRLAERAVVLDPHDARALTIAGHIRAFLHHRLREAAALHEQALQLNPNLAMAWSLSAATCIYLGDAEEAERRNTRYKKLSPFDPHAFLFDTFFIQINLLKRDYESAVVVGRQVSQTNPDFSAACKPYLAALGHLGQMQEAAVVRRRLLSIEPDFTVLRFLATSPWARAEDREHYALGLRLAGIPEGDATAAIGLRGGAPALG
jgi:DNA-binding SARP family transcriptional activator/TolB-like protein